MLRQCGCGYRCWHNRLGQGAHDCGKVWRVVWRRLCRGATPGLQAPVVLVLCSMPLPNEANLGFPRHTVLAVARAL